MLKKIQKVIRVDEKKFKEFLEKTEKTARTFYEKLDSAHYSDAWYFDLHVEDVRKHALLMVNKYGGNKQEIEIACLLHDIGVESYYHEGFGFSSEKSAELAKKVLNQIGFPEDFIRSVLEIIDPPAILSFQQPLETKIVSTANAVSLLKNAFPFYLIVFLHSMDIRKYLNWAILKSSMDSNKIAFSDEREIVRPIVNTLQMCLKHDLTKLNKNLFVEQAKLFRTLSIEKSKQPSQNNQTVKQSVVPINCVSSTVDEVPFKIKKANHLMSELFSLGKENLELLKASGMSNSERDAKLEIVKLRAVTIFTELQQFLPLVEAEKVRKDIRNRYLIHF